MDKKFLIFVIFLLFFIFGCTVEKDSSILGNAYGYFYTGVHDLSYDGESLSLDIENGVFAIYRNISVNGEFKDNRVGNDYPGQISSFTILSDKYPVSGMIDIDGLEDGENDIRVVAYKLKVLNGEASWDTENYYVFRTKYYKEKPFECESGEEICLSDSSAKSCVDGFWQEKECFYCAEDTCLPEPNKNGTDDGNIDEADFSYPELEEYIVDEYYEEDNYDGVSIKRYEADLKIDNRYFYFSVIHVSDRSLFENDAVEIVRDYIIDDEGFMSNHCDSETVWVSGNNYVVLDDYQEIIYDVLTERYPPSVDFLDASIEYEPTCIDGTSKGDISTDGKYCSYGGELLESCCFVGCSEGLCGWSDEAGVRVCSTEFECLHDSDCTREYSKGYCSGYECRYQDYLLGEKNIAVVGFYENESVNESEIKVFASEDVCFAGYADEDQVRAQLQSGRELRAEISLIDFFYNENKEVFYDKSGNICSTFYPPKYLKTYIEGLASEYDAYVNLNVDIVGMVEVEERVPIRGRNDGSEMLKEYFLRKSGENSLDLEGYDSVVFVYFLPGSSDSRFVSTLDDGYMYVQTIMGRNSYEEQIINTATHEFLHDYGAHDTYDVFDCRYPEGYYDPYKEPLYPQSYGCIMCGNIKKDEVTSFMPGIEYFKVCPYNAERLGWSTEGFEPMPGPEPEPVVCPEGHAYKKGYCVPFLNELNFVDLPYHRMLSEEIEIFPNFVVDNWYDYAPMNDKVTQLTQGLDSDYDKASAILNWVKKSKTYCDTGMEDVCDSLTNEAHSKQISAMADLEQGNEVNPSDLDLDSKIYVQNYESGYGVCLDAAIMAIGMLRKAGIPTTYNFVDNNHIDVVMIIDGKVYIADPTFGVVSDVMLLDLEEINYGYSHTFLYEDAGKKVCTPTGCFTYPETEGFILRYNFDNFVSQEFGTVYYPNKNNFYSTNDGEGESFFCNLATESIGSDSFGYYENEYMFGNLQENYEDVTNWKIMSPDIYYYFDENEDNAGFGYNSLSLPAGAWNRYSCGYWDPETGEEPVLTEMYFKLEDGENFVIKPGDLVKKEGVSQEIFDEFIETMNINLYLVETLSLIEN